METATIAATCKRKNLDYFTFYYAGDNLDSIEWEERSLSGLVELDKKKEVMFLTLELAYKLKNMKKLLNSNFFYYKFSLRWW